MFDQFMKGFSAMQMPQFDASKLTTMQQKNTEMFTGTAQMFGETAQAMAQKSAEFAQANFEAATSASRDIFTTTAPDQNIAKQGENLKKSLTTSAKQTRELAKMATDAQFKAIDTMNKQIGQAIDESREFFKTAA